jgi:hypothetical protein
MVDLNVLKQLIILLDEIDNEHWVYRDTALRALLVAVLV